MGGGTGFYSLPPESSTYGTAPVKKSWVAKRTTPRKLTWNLKNPALKFHVSFQRTMYTYMYYTILTMYYILSSWERCRFKGMCWKKSFKVHRGVLIAKCGQNADHLGILDSQIVQITRRWHGLPRKMGHASRFVENDKILMAMFSFYFVVAKKKSYISMVSEVFSRHCFMLMIIWKKNWLSNC